MRAARGQGVDFYAGLNGFALGAGRLVDPMADGDGFRRKWSVGLLWLGYDSLWPGEGDWLLAFGQRRGEGATLGLAAREVFGLAVAAS